MKQEEIEKTLYGFYGEYYLKVKALLERVFEEVVKPVCKKRGWGFISGMGTFWVGPPGMSNSLYKEDLSEDDEECRKMFDILNTSIPGFEQIIGSYMPDFQGGE